MPLVMFRRRLIVTSFHAGYSGSHLPSASLIESFPAASSLRIAATVNDFDVVPIWQRVYRLTERASGPGLLFPAKASIACPATPKLMYAAMPVTFSIGARAASHVSSAP